MWAMFAVIALAFMPTQVPLGITEGVVTALAYRFVLVRRPELLRIARQPASWQERRYEIRSDLARRRPFHGWNRRGDSR